MLWCIDLIVLFFCLHKYLHFLYKCSNLVLLLALLNLDLLVHPLVLEEGLIGLAHSLGNSGYSIFASHSCVGLCIDILLCKFLGLYSDCLHLRCLACELLAKLVDIDRDKFEKRGRRLDIVKRA